jgi:CheY-like chemotaxis protein
MMKERTAGEEAVHENQAEHIRELERQRDELDRAGRARDEFFAILSHELRNHIQTIGTNALLVKSRSRDVEVTRPADAIDRQVAKMSKLLTDLLDVVRATRKSDLVLEAVDIQRIVGAAVNGAKLAVDAHRRELTVEMPEDPLYVKADAERLQQAIGNLIQNAVKYSPQQGAIMVLVGEEDGKAAVSVRDQGHGIAPEDLSHLFTLDKQRTASKRSTSGGLGIGLHVAREVAEAHGGSIEARSPGLGQGSQFILRVPLTAERPSRAARDPEEIEARFGRALSILVVDDNRDAADSLAEVLQVYGHSAQVAYGGEEAMELAQRGGVQVALVDIGMPTVDGFEVARRISRSSRGGDIMLIAVTGWGAQADRARSKEAGFAYHLTKPIDYPTLLTLLATAARKSARPS